MKKNQKVFSLLLTLLLLMGSFLTPEAFTGNLPKANLPDSVPGEYIVQFKIPEMGALNFTEILPENATVLDNFNQLPGLAKISFEAPKTGLMNLNNSQDADLEALRNHPSVEYAQPNFIYVHQGYVPPDPQTVTQWTYLWGLENTGQTVGEVTGTPGFDINILPAWEITAGSPEVIVAISDDGVWENHEALKSQILESDANDQAEILKDGSGQGQHGTHVAGTVAAAQGYSTIGVAPNIKILPVNVFVHYFDGVPYTTTGEIIHFIEYIDAENAQISNNSWGRVNPENPDGTLKTNDLALRSALKSIEDRHLFVAAAGNTGDSIDETPFFPASLGNHTYSEDNDPPLKNVLAVAAHNQHGRLASFSNFGVESVGIAAPGTSVISSLPYRKDDDSIGSGYGYGSGTSMAAPHVSGVAALMLSVNPDLTPAELIEIIQSTGAPLPNAQDRGKIKSGAMLDAYAAVLRARDLAMDRPLLQAEPDSIQLSAETGEVAIQLNLQNTEIIFEESIEKASVNLGGALESTSVSSVTRNSDNTQQAELILDVTNAEPGNGSIRINAENLFNTDLDSTEAVISLVMDENGSEEDASEATDQIPALNEPEEPIESDEPEEPSDSSGSGSTDDGSTTSGGGGGGGGGGGLPGAARIQMLSGRDRTVTRDDFTLFIPRDSLNMDTYLNIRPLSAFRRDPEEGQEIISKIYNLTLEDNHYFDGPVTLTFSYSPDKVQDGKIPVLSWFDEETEKWIPLEEQQIDDEKQTVSGSINHFTPFAVLTVPVEATTKETEEEEGTIDEAEVKTDEEIPMLRVTFTVNQTGYHENGRHVESDAAPYIQPLPDGTGRIMVPVSFASRALGADEVSWDPLTRKVTVVKESNTIKLTIDDRTMRINDESFIMDVPAVIQPVAGGGRTMIPVAHLARALDVHYTWDPATETVVFHYKTSPPYSPFTI